MIIAAGDIASCVSEGDEATALLVQAISGTVITMGDNAYDNGTAEQFNGCYDPSWGQFKDRTRPSPGNHDYLVPAAAGYFDYFGAAAGELGKGYYSYDLGAWHLIAINSMCWEVGGCGAESPQAVWLAADLAAHPVACTLAYWHHPRFSSGLHGNLDLMQTLWDVLYAGGADVVLNGHDHVYERFAPQDPQGAADPARGIREIIAGTGGRSLYPFAGPARPNSEVRSASTYGVLKMTLHADSYDWEFVPVAGETFTDSGTGECHP
ncbi:MAG: metallophosphoesterase [Anaerolineales bacterium]